jgi:hypothetical protein
MKRRLLAHSLSAVAVFIAGLVAGQSGGFALQVAASKSALAPKGSYLGFTGTRLAALRKAVTSTLIVKSAGDGSVSAPVTVASVWGGHNPHSPDVLPTRRDRAPISSPRGPPTTSS